MTLSDDKERPIETKHEKNEREMSQIVGRESEREKKMSQEMEVEIRYFIGDQILGSR